MVVPLKQRRVLRVCIPLVCNGYFIFRGRGDALTLERHDKYKLRYDKADERYELTGCTYDRLREAFRIIREWRKGKERLEQWAKTCCRHEQAAGQKGRAGHSYADPVEIRRRAYENRSDD